MNRWYSSPIRKDATEDLAGFDLRLRDNRDDDDDDEEDDERERNHDDEDDEDLDDELEDEGYSV